jgi:hypothetical protein
MRTLLASALAVGACASMRDGGAAHAPVLLVSFDGMRADYLTSNRVATPNFDAFAAGGVHVTGGMNAAFVTKTFPNHWTLVTGLWEESHGIVGNRCTRRPPATPILSYHSRICLPHLALRRGRSLDQHPSQSDTTDHCPRPHRTAPYCIAACWTPPSRASVSL